MVELKTLSDNEGARKERKRVGRGIGSGKGKTCGRGMKGQKSRSGVAIKGFEGGQMPIFRRLPKRGFTNIHRVEYQVVNLSDIDRAIEGKRLVKTDAINIASLAEAGLVRTIKQPVKLLGNGELKTKVNIVVDKASRSAVAAVKKAGGSLELNQQS